MALLQSLFNSSRRSCYRNNRDNRLQLHIHLRDNDFHKVRLRKQLENKILRSSLRISIANRLYQLGSYIFQCIAQLVQESIQFLQIAGLSISVHSSQIEHPLFP